MKQWRGWLLGMLLCTGAAPSAGQTPALTGRIFLGFQGRTPAPQVRVTLSGLNPTRTDDQGVFQLSLRATTQAGKRIRLDIDKPGWCILSPFNGEVVVPSDQGEDRPIEVRLLRSDSRQGTTEDCIGRFIAAANKSRSEARPDPRPELLELARGPQGAAPPAPKPEPLDLVRELKEWAARQDLQLTEQQAREVLTHWVAEVNAQPRDPYLLGLARLADEQFGAARQLFMQAATAEERQLAAGQQRATRNYRLAGDAARQEGNYEAALQAYQKAYTHSLLGSDPSEPAIISTSIGYMHELLESRSPPERAREHRAATVSSYQRAQQYFTRDRVPVIWADLQSSLSEVLRRQGDAAAGAERQRLYEEAVRACRLVLQAAIRDQSSEEWARAQLTLGNALLQQGRGAKGAKSQRLLEEAVHAYEDALQVFSRKDKRPQLWALVQGNLALTRYSQGRRARGAESLRLLGESARLQREVLQVCTRDKEPQIWARTQFNLGMALSSHAWRAERAVGWQLLGAAVQAYRAALQVHTRDKLPQEWQRAQTELLTALNVQWRNAAGAERQRLLGELAEVYGLLIATAARGTPE